MQSHLFNFVLFLPVFTCNTRQGTKWIKNVYPGFVNIDDAMISSLSDVRTKVRCGTYCAENVACRSFSYRNDGSCRLHSLRFVVTNPSSNNALPEWSSYYLTAGTCPLKAGFVFLDDLKLCFKVFEDRKTFTDARTTCRDLGTRLITVDTMEKNTAVSNYIVDNISTSRYYIGLTDLDTEGRFLWETGDTAVFLNWNSNEPNNYENEDCVFLITLLNTWADIRCTRKEKYICEYPV